MKTIKPHIVIAVVITLLLAPVGWRGIQQAKANALCDALGSTGIPFVGSVCGALTGGEAVRIVADNSPTTIQNTLRTAAIDIATGIMSGNITSMNWKETVLDPMAWAVSSQLQQQLSSDMLRWLGGVDQDGNPTQVPFVQDFGEHYADIGDRVDAQLYNQLQGQAGGTGGLRTVDERFEVTNALAYARYRRALEAGQAPGNEGVIFDPPNTEGLNTLTSLFLDALHCDGDTNCASFKAQRIGSDRRNTIQGLEREMLQISDGMLPQYSTTCIERNEAGDCIRQRRELNSPLYLASEGAVQQIIRAPSDRILAGDEFNELIGNFFGQLTNMAATGIGRFGDELVSTAAGVLGLAGNPNASGRLEWSGSGGEALSFIQQLVNEDISRIQGGNTNIIEEALRAQTEWRRLNRLVLDQIIKPVEDKAAANMADASLRSGCYDLTLASENSGAAGQLRTRKTDAEKASNDSDTIINGAGAYPGLTVLSAQYGAGDSNQRQAALNIFMTLKSDPNITIADTVSNIRFEMMEINNNIKTQEQLFRLEMAQKRCECGASTLDREGIDIITEDASCSSG